MVWSGRTSSRLSFFTATSTSSGRITTNTPLTKYQYSFAILKSIELEYGLKVNEYIDDKWRAAEELVAHIAEQEGSNSIVARVVEFVRKFLERIGVITAKNTWSDQEIRQLIAESHASLMLNKEVQSRTSLRDATIVEEVTVEETGEVFEVERSANDAISDVDKRISICKKLRNCL